MILKLTKKQSQQVHALARRRCCNCVNGSCVLLDDREDRTCVQLLSRHGVNCKHFRDAVLPGDRKLYTEILKSNQRRNER